MAEISTLTLPLLALNRGVVLPNMVVTVAIETEEARTAIAAALNGPGRLLLVPRIDGVYAHAGVVASVEDAGPHGGPQAVVVRGLHRAQVGSGVPGDGDATWVQAEPIPDPAISSEHATTLAREYRAVIENIVEARGNPEIAMFLRNVREPGALADLSGYSPDLSFEQKVQVLETIDVEERLEKVLGWARETLDEVRVTEKIRGEVEDGFRNAQREAILRQQMAAIRKELRDDGSEDTIEEYRKKIAESGMPDAVRAEAEHELKRLERTPEQNMEHGWIRTYLDWMTEIPWGVRSDDLLEVTEARRILDEDHTGLEEIKDRIIEHLAVRKLKKERGIEDSGRSGGAIITLVGPPGVGKTSLGESVARALGRKFGRIALGGIRDEAEIRGHRRTYVGALPGRLARAMKDAGTMNPVLLLDEVDKVGADWRGDPSSALLEVLDPAQNHTFRDHYLDVDLDLSEVLFIATANVAEQIPGPLLDRMELLRLDGYTEDEKVEIAREHLLERRIADAGLTTDELEVTDEALRTVITEYTREAGVRNLERQLGKVTRKAATRIAFGEAQAPVTIDAPQIKEFLGRARFQPEAPDRTAVPGVATGLAVTGMGGDVLFIEATAMDGEAGLTLTGQLGEVMKESAQIALSYVRSHAVQLGLDPSFENKRFHLHVPAGAVPKDGPSAGITMTTAIVSLLAGRPVKDTVGMTGEVTLQGRVLPIGGLKQKVLAAHRAGLTEVIIPARNEPDLEDVPEKIRKDMTFHLVGDVAEVLSIALDIENVKAA